VVQAGERNRGLSIIKSRGTAHSNQVRELILSDSGVTLADTYYGGRRGPDGHASLAKGKR
jgi:circadian clock protein KaiC